MEAKADSALNKNEFYRKKRTAIFQDDIMNRNSKTTTLYMKAWRDVLFGRYNTAKNYLSELRQIKEKINSPTAMYDYNNLLGMVTLMEGNAQESLEAFDKGDPDNTYFLYFKALALRASGDKTGAKKILTDIANTNFSYWQLALVRERARTMLEDL
jgi:predicted Zn-dependent protease